MTPERFEAVYVASLGDPGRSYAPRAHLRPGTTTTLCGRPATQPAVARPPDHLVCRRCLAKARLVEGTG